jgi:small subunit ribosomal protein S18
VSEERRDSAPRVDRGDRPERATGAGGERTRRRFGGSGSARYYPRRKVCHFCMDQIGEVDYKDFGRLRRYISDRGKIEPRRQTGTCEKHQRSLAVAIKRARHVALLPFTQ